MSDKMLTRSEWKRLVGDGSGGAIGLPEIPPLRKIVTTEIRLLETDPQTGMQDVTFTLSTGALDRDSDVINPDGWEVDAYLSNPVVLWAHQYSTPPIARATEVWAEDGKLLATDRFTPHDVNPFGAMVYRLVAGGFLKSVSVGFRPVEYVYNDDHHGYDFQRQELLEHSIVPVPSNPEALIAAGATGIDLAPLREWAEKILDADPESDARAALWLPRETIEQVRRAAGHVAPTLIETSTADGDEPTNPTAADVEPDAAEETMTEREETLMKEAIQALTEVIRELREEVEKLPDAILAKMPEPEPEPEPTAEPEKDADGATPEPEPEPEEVSEEDAKAIVREVIEQELLAKTGKLPD